MRILLDECVNPRLRLAFPGDEVKTVVEMGWRSLTNGQLLNEEAPYFDILVTLDQNLRFQNPTGTHPLASFGDPCSDHSIQSSCRLPAAVRSDPRPRQANEAWAGQRSSDWLVPGHRRPGQHRGDPGAAEQGVSPPEATPQLSGQLLKLSADSLPATQRLRTMANLRDKFSVWSG